jgi:Fe-S cluster biosynthesis and repair protein YggX
MKSVCQDCWNEWERAQLVIINEYRLIPATREHRRFLVEQMKRFLNLR